MITILPYTERWAAEFAVIGAALRQAVGRRAERIDHIGSTSVPGLDAKDVIDVQLTVATFEPAGELEQSISRLGYLPRPAISADHTPALMCAAADQWVKRFFHTTSNQRRVHLHVRISGRANQRYALLFRDYLRAHPASAASYAAVKQQLAHYHPDNATAYVTIKDPVCDLIMAAAEAWAVAHGWQPGPSDA